MNLNDNDREASVSLIKAALAPEHGTQERHMLAKGDEPGHPFRGNQYQSGEAAALLAQEVANVRATMERGGLNSALFSSRREQAAWVERQEAKLKQKTSVAVKVRNSDNTHTIHVVNGLPKEANRHQVASDYLKSKGLNVVSAWDKDSTQVAMPSQSKNILANNFYEHQYGQKDKPGSVENTWTSAKRAATEKMQKGDQPGHPFRGNQYQTGGGSMQPKAWDGVEQLKRGHIVSLVGEGSHQHVVLEAEDERGAMPRVLVAALNTGMSIAPTERVDRVFVRPAASVEAVRAKFMQEAAKDSGTKASTARTIAMNALAQRAGFHNAQQAYEVLIGSKAKSQDGPGPSTVQGKPGAK